MILQLKRLPFRTDHPFLNKTSVACILHIHSVVFVYFKDNHYIYVKEQSSRLPHWNYLKMWKKTFQMLN